MEVVSERIVLSGIGAKNIEALKKYLCGFLMP